MELTMQKKIVLSLSSLLFTMPINADITQIEQMGFMVTRECMERGEFNDCPVSQLSKITAQNPLVLFQGDEHKAYILDLSGVDQASVMKLGMKNDIIVTGNLQNDQKTLQVQKIEKYIQRPFRTKGVI
jgi:hypothetical protein